MAACTSTSTEAQTIPKATGSVTPSIASSWGPTPAGGIGYAYFFNPLETNRVNPRSWTDKDGDFVPDGDPLNPNANGELGPSTNRDFANPHINTFSDPDWAFGFHKRPSQWEFSTSVQRELVQGLSVNVGYVRRVYTNLELLYNRAFGSTDLDYFCVTAPVSAALPNGGGRQVCGIPDLRPSTGGYQSKIGNLDNIMTAADNLGTRLYHWNGVDMTADARLRGFLLQGGLSVGKFSVNECDLVGAAPSFQFRGTGTGSVGSGAVNERVPRDYCDKITVSSVATGSVLGGSTTPWQAQVKLLGSYRLPYEVQVSAAYQTFPGRERLANVSFNNAAVAPSLRRPLSQTSSVLINVIDPGTVFGDRVQQLDLRASKSFNLGRNRVRANLDVYNIVNNNAGLNYRTAFNPANPKAWQAPGACSCAKARAAVPLLRQRRTRSNIAVRRSSNAGMQVTSGTSIAQWPGQRKDGVHRTVTAQVQHPLRAS